MVSVLNKILLLLNFAKTFSLISELLLFLTVIESSCSSVVLLIVLAPIKIALLLAEFLIIPFSVCFSISLAINKIYVSSSVEEKLAILEFVAFKLKNGLYDIMTNVFV